MSEESEASEASEEGEILRVKRQREQRLKVWSSQQVVRRGASDVEWHVVSGDASFRRYFRLAEGQEGASWIAVDAPPDKENNPAFINVLHRLSEAGVTVPELLASDLTEGFMLLSDLGDQLLLPLLTRKSVDGWYQAGMSLLLNIQQASTYELAHYSQEKLRNEMQLFEQWFLPHYLGLNADQQVCDQLSAVYDRLEHSALSQPQCFVHRDFHARNLMVLDAAHRRLGAIDFQDAVLGPVTYDLVSLIKDCYKAWPIEQVDQWAQQFRVRLQSQEGALKAPFVGVTEGQWQQWFDWMGLQRHIKVAGIFSRLYFRDGKSGYLKDIPRTVHYIYTMLARYQSEFGWLFEYVVDQVIPALVMKNPDASPLFDHAHLK